MKEGTLSSAPMAQRNSLCVIAEHLVEEQAYSLHERML